MATKRRPVSLYKRFKIGETWKGKAIEERAFRRACMHRHAKRWIRQPGYTPLFSVLPTIEVHSKCHGIGEVLSYSLNIG